MADVPYKSFLILYLAKSHKREGEKLVGTEEIWECRIQFGSNAYRIFCFFMDNSVVLTHGFVKKSQRTPFHEIERAEAYKRDFLRRRV